MYLSPWGGVTGASVESSFTGGGGVSTVESSMKNQTLFYLIVYDLPDNKAANKRIFDGTKRGRKTRFAVKTLGTLTIKDFSRF